MPSAATILHASKAAIGAARGSGLAGLAVQALLGPQGRALTDLIVADSNPSASGPVHPAEPEGEAPNKKEPAT